MNINFEAKYKKYKYKYNQLKLQMKTVNNNNYNQLKSQMKTVNNYNYNYYYKNKEEEEDILERKLYECPIFTTHNTFIWKKTDFLGGIFSEVTVDSFDNYIDYIINLTLKFPVYIELDSKYIFNLFNCKLAHGFAYSNKFKNLKELIDTIIIKYNELQSEKKYPLIIQLDFISEYFIKYSYDSCKFNLESKLRNCLNKIIYEKNINNIISKGVSKSLIDKVNKLQIVKDICKGVSKSLIDKVNKLQIVKDICNELKIKNSKDNLYKLYPLTLSQNYISERLVKLILKLFDSPNLELGEKSKLPTLISFNLYNLYEKKSKLLTDLESKFENFYKL